MAASGEEGRGDEPWEAVGDHEGVGGDEEDEGGWAGGDGAACSWAAWGVQVRWVPAGGEVEGSWGGAMRPLAIELFSGLHGWGEGFAAEGWRSIGFDIVDMCGQFGIPRPEHCELVLQDVTTLDGRQLKDAQIIVASPPCQAYSYRAMPWKRAKALPPPDNTLFEACFRIQREASEAAGRHIPLIVENVRGAQPWVGRAKANFGSYYLWGDVARVGNRIVPDLGAPRFGAETLDSPTGRMKFNPDGTAHPQGSWFAIADSKQRGKHSEGFKSAGLNWSDPTKRGQDFTRVAGKQAVKNAGRNTWFGIQSNGERFPGQPGNPVNSGLKIGDKNTFRVDGKPSTHFTNPGEGIKNGNDWFSSGDGCSLQRRHSSRSNARKQASALIAKIPFPLARYIASAFKPNA